VLQVAAQVMCNDATITIGGQAGNFELNVMMPVIAYNLLQSIDLLAASARVFAEKCVSGIAANPGVCAAFIEQSLALATGLVPRIGYDRAAAVARKAYDSGRTVRAVLTEERILSKEEIDRLLDI